MSLCIVGAFSLALRLFIIYSKITSPRCQTSHHPEPMDILEECGPETLDELINNIQELELEVGD